MIVSRSELIQQELPSDRRVGDFIEVIVNEVGSPQRFWIRLNGNTNKAMDHLMDQMDTFYYRSVFSKIFLELNFIIISVLNPPSTKCLPVMLLLGFSAPLCSWTGRGTELKSRKLLTKVTWRSSSWTTAQMPR